MKPLLKIMPATDEHAVDLAATMRDEDMLEIEATSGRDPLTVILNGIDQSEESWAAMADNLLLGVYGVVEGSPSMLGKRDGVVWLLTSIHVEAHKRIFWEGCMCVLDDLFTRWDELYNAIDCRHVKALRWADRLGFRIGEPMPYGVAGLDFRGFCVTREDLHV